MKILHLIIAIPTLLISCSSPEREISDELYQKALLYLSFQDGPISQFYENAGCVEIDSSRFYFSEGHYAFRKFWDGANIYKHGDTIGYFGGSCIFRAEVYILYRTNNQVVLYDAHEFYRNTSETFSSETLNSFIPMDTLHVFNVEYTDDWLRVKYDDNNSSVLAIQKTSDREFVHHFTYWDKQNPATPIMITKVYQDSLIQFESIGDYQQELILKRLDSSYSLREFNDSVLVLPVVKSEVVIEPEC